jgi:RNA polymerase sigma-70 factor (ECF subfamily)
MWSSPDKALEYIYDNYYEKLCNLVYRITKDSVVSEDIVQDVFFEIWRKRDEIFINSSLEAYLRRSCRNKTLNYIRSNNLHWEDESELNEQIDTGFTAEEYLAADELQHRINKVIGNLPEKCRLVFALSRFEEMSYSDISKELNISVKTVENHISKALKVLRENIYNKNEI